MIKHLTSRLLQNRSNSQSGHAHLRAWYRHAVAGQRLQTQIGDDIALILDEWFGYHILVIGVDAGLDISAMTRVQHVCSMISGDLREANPQGVQQRVTQVIARDEALPIETESVDVVVMLNALEISEQPHQVLREAHRVLTPHGHLLVVGSNPNSLRGLWNRLRALSRSGRSVPVGIAITKLGDWLKLLHFSVAPTRHKLLLPFGGNSRLGRWLARIDDWLADHNIPPGSSYVVYANKMVVGHISAQRSERVKARLMGLPVAKPVVGARSSSTSRSENAPLRPVE